MGTDLPTYDYVQVHWDKRTNTPLFRCRASFRRVAAEALGNSKKDARQRAAYELLRKINEVVSEP